VSTPGRGRTAWLVAGLLAFVGGTWIGWNGAVLDALLGAPAVLRAAFVAVFVLGALWCLRQAVERIEASRGAPAGELTGRDLAALVRGVRYVFLAVASVSAAAGWLMGHPLPIIVALVIAGVDIIETTLLLVVVTLRKET
jgi:hypothetical protein